VVVARAHAAVLEAALPHDHADGAVAGETKTETETRARARARTAAGALLAQPPLAGDHRGRAAAEAAAEAEAAMRGADLGTQLSLRLPAPRAAAAAAADEAAPAARAITGLLLFPDGTVSFAPPPGADAATAIARAVIGAHGELVPVPVPVAKVLAI
jgi:hypothetical protein